MKIKFKYTLALILFVQYCFSQNIPSELNGIEDDINYLIKQYDAVGLSVAVVKDGEIIYSKGFGYRDLEQKLPVTTNTVFPIGSMTKSFTGALLGILEAKNQILLTEKPSVYIPDFHFYNDKMDNLITIEDLLSHKSGIGDQGTSQVFFPDNNKLKTVQRLKYLKPEGEIKNSFLYSNMAYTLAGTIVEQVTNKSWDLNIQERIFGPFKMSNSYTSYEGMKRSNNYSYGYGLYKGKTEKINFENMYAIGPAGAIKSTVLDMSKWMLAWLNNGDFEGLNVIPTAYVKKATVLQNSDGSDYEKEAFLFGNGFGWRLRSSYGYFRVEHGGNNFGFSSDMMLFPFEGIGIVVLTNQNLSSLPYMIADNIVKRLFELEPEAKYPTVITDIYKPNPERKGLNKDTLPTHPLEDFVGAYFAKGFGKIEVIKEGTKLFAILPTYKFLLEHLNYNSFFFKGTMDFKEPFSPEWTIKFIDDTRGEITVLELHSQKEPIEFVKE
jgi:CubicO group peptidase (beta-lactamase class C family)